LVHSNLVQAILTEDVGAQIELIKGLSASSDSLVEQALAAWRQGGVFLYETNDARIPFLLEAQSDSEGKARAIKVGDGEFLKDAAGKPLLFVPSELTAVDTTAKLRKSIKTTLDLFALSNPNPHMRRDAVTKLGQEQNSEYLAHFEARLQNEKSVEVRKALHEAVALTQMNSADEAVRVKAIEQLGELRSINALSFLQQLETAARANPVQYGEATRMAVQRTLATLQNYIWWGNLFGTAFRGLSLSAVLLWLRWALPSPSA
jgi:urea transport system permease protein